MQRVEKSLKATSANFNERHLYKTVNNFCITEGKATIPQADSRQVSETD
jgi:hypothetical protein